MSDGLQNEKALFESKRKEWMASHANEWVWIHGSDVEFFQTYEKAIETAYSKGFDKEPIFVKQVTDKDEETFIAGLYNWAV